MKISVSKIIIFIFVTFFLFIFWRGLQINNNYDTKSLIGNRISNFELIKIDDSDKFITEEDLKQNNYTLINFFASWCGPCRNEHNYLLNLSKENTKIKDLAFNYPKEESLLSFLDINVLKEINGNSAVSSSITEVFKQINKNNEVHWLWKWFLALAIVSLLLEILILKFYTP